MKKIALKYHCKTRANHLPRMCTFNFISPSCLKGKLVELRVAVLWWRHKTEQTACAGSLQNSTPKRSESQKNNKMQKGCAYSQIQQKFTFSSSQWQQPYRTLLQICSKIEEKYGLSTVALLLQKWLCMTVTLRCPVFSLPLSDSRANEYIYEFNISDCKCPIHHAVYEVPLGSFCPSLALKKNKKISFWPSLAKKNLKKEKKKSQPG